MDSNRGPGGPPAPPPEGGRTLTGWREIAGYFGRDVRSVQRWGKQRGLPVQRILTQGRGGPMTVQARTDQLDEWLRGPAAPADVRAGPEPAPRPVPANISEPPAKPARRRRRWPRLSPRRMRLWVVARMLLIVGLLVAGTAILSSDQGKPDRVVLESGCTLSALDAAGKTLWQRDFTPMNAGPVTAADVPPLLVDLNRDSHNEIVFGYMNDGSDAGDKDRVICLDEKGSDLWSYRPGGTVVLAGVTVPDSYRIRRIRAPGRLAGGGLFVVAVSNSRFLDASLVSVLTSRGDLIGVYWHAGWILDCEILDDDQDGDDEIALVGVDQPAGKAFVAIIRPDTPKSISPVIGGYAPGLEMHKELAYLLFPDSMQASIMGLENQAARVETHSDPPGLTVEIVQYGGQREVLERTYLLDGQLRFIRLMVTDEFLIQWQRLEKIKLLSSAPRNDEVGRLCRLQPVYGR